MGIVSEVKRMKRKATAFDHIERMAIKLGLPVSLLVTNPNIQAKVICDLLEKHARDIGVYQGVVQKRSAREPYLDMAERDAWYHSLPKDPTTQTGVCPCGMVAPHIPIRTQEDADKMNEWVDTHYEHR